MKNHKKIVFVILAFILSLFFQTGIVLAVSTTTTPTQTSSPRPTEKAQINDKIQELKDKLASRVAELNEVSQKVIVGEIKTLSDEKIILLTNESEINVEINDDTVFYELGRDYKRKEIKLEDFEAGDNIIVWGAFNSSANSLTTKNVYRQPNDVTFVGTIKGVDKKNFQISVIDLEKNNYTVDIEVDTKVNQYNASEGLIKIGFSNLQPGQFVYVLAAPSPSNKRDLVSGKNVSVIFAPSSISSPTPTGKGE